MFAVCFIGNDQLRASMQPKDRPLPGSMMRDGMRLASTPWLKLDGENEDLTNGTYFLRCKPIA